VIVLFVVWLSHVKAPDVGIKSVKMDPINFGTQPVPISMTAKFWIDNPNGWPLSASVKNASIDVFSLDRVNDTSGNLLFLGKASLAGPFEISTHANVSFGVDFHSEISVGQEQLIARLKRDCVVQQGQPVGTTKLRLNLTQAELSFWKRDNTFDIGYHLDTVVPCPIARLGSDAKHGVDMSSKALLV